MLTMDYINNDTPELNVLEQSASSSRNGGLHVVELFCFSAPVSAIHNYFDDRFLSPHATPCTSQMCS